DACWLSIESIVSFLSQVIWSHTRAQVKSQMPIPPVIAKILPLEFSVLEREYYDATATTLTDSQRAQFCKDGVDDIVSFTVLLVEALRYEISLLRRTLISHIYNDALTLYFVHGDDQHKLGAIKTLSYVIEVFQHCNKTAFLQIEDELWWQEMIVKCIVSL